MILYGFYDNVYYLQTGVEFVVCFNDVPRSESGGCFCDHFIHGLFILIPFVTVSPVLVSYLSLLFRIVLAVGESSQLFVTVNVQPEFYNYRT